jgi:hypothetical protein
MNVVLTLDEVACLMHKSRRWLREWLRDNPRDAYDRPLFGEAGRTLLFTQAHVQRIVETLPCPSSLSRPVKRKQRTSISAGSISVSQWTRAAELTSDPSLKPSSSGSRGKLN